MADLVHTRPRFFPCILTILCCKHSYVWKTEAQKAFVICCKSPGRKWWPASSPRSRLQSPLLVQLHLRLWFEIGLLLLYYVEVSNFKFSQFSNIKQVSEFISKWYIKVKIPSLYTQTLGVQHFRQKEIRSWGAHRATDTQRNWHVLVVNHLFLFCAEIEEIYLVLKMKCSWNMHPGGSVVKNLPTKAGDAGLIPG